MPRHLVLPLPSPSPRFIKLCASKPGGSRKMNHQSASTRKPVRFRLCKVSSYTTELLEIPSDDRKLHVLFVPGNPGVVSLYKDFLESLYELLGGAASITGIGHIAHTEKNWEHGKLFSLQEQIDHKVHFISQELQNIDIPIVLVGHSIGSYISIETLRRSPKKVIYLIGLYPFLMLNPESKKQSYISKIAESSILPSLLSLSASSLGLLPKFARRLIVSKSIGWSWSSAAVDAACSHLLKYHTLRNIIFMTLTEFRKLSETPDWAFMTQNQGKIAFMYGVDDHWGPLEMYEEISKQVPGIALSIEREGHTHSFCCTEAGSDWVARYVASMIKNQISSSIQ